LSFITKGGSNKTKEDLIWIRGEIKKIIKEL